MGSTVKLNLSFSKGCIEKKRALQCQVRFYSLLVLYEKEQQLNIET